MMADAVYIADVRVPNVSAVEVGRFDISNARRTASGMMVKDIIATKLRVDVTCKMLPDSKLQEILSAIEALQPFFPVTFPYAGGQKTITCYSGDIIMSLWRTVNGVRYWNEVKMAFIEQ